MSVLSIGDRSLFAIESSITRAFERPSLRALGYFVIYVGAQRYGIEAPDASMLACSFDEVARRLTARGKHVAPFSSFSDVAEIVRAHNKTIWEGGSKDCNFFGMSGAEVRDAFINGEISWAPDGDAAFDDGSRVLQFDVGDMVRLVGYRSHVSFGQIQASISDQMINADVFYGILADWHHRFDAEWSMTPKAVQ